MRKVVSAGGLIFDGSKMLVVKHSYGYGLPKGHVEPGETLEQTAVRELREEAALETRVIRYIGKANRLSTETTGEVVEKDIELFLMQVTGKAEVEPEEITEWLEVGEAIKMMAHDAERDFLREHALALVDVAAQKDD